MEEYKGNSFKSREQHVTTPATKPAERKPIAKAVSGPVKVKKKTEASKFKDLFVANDVSNVRDYVLMDVLIPAVKKAVSDIVTNGIDMLLYGATGGPNRKKSMSSKVSYSRYYDDPRERSRFDDRDSIRARTTGYSYDEIVVETRGEAEDVIDRLKEMIDMYDQACVADLYDLVGVTGNYTDNKYGWTNLRNAEPVRVRDGYLIKLPKALPLN